MAQNNDNASGAQAGGTGPEQNTSSSATHSSNVSNGANNAAASNSTSTTTNNSTSVQSTTTAPAATAPNSFVANVRARITAATSYTFSYERYNELIADGPDIAIMLFDSYIREEKWDEARSLHDAFMRSQYRAGWRRARREWEQRQ